MASVEKINLLSRVKSIDSSPPFTTYSKVIIHTDDENYVEAGNNTGRKLEISDPFGTPTLARQLLAKLSGLQYQPYSATGAILDPAAEIGDAVSIKEVFGGIYQRQRRFDRQMQADIAAPHDEEINHEYAFESQLERSFTRQINDVKASLIVANGQIAAKVSQTGGAASSFGWALTSNAHRWYANNREVMSVTASGLTVRGVIEALSGKIGNFNIGANAIWNNISQFGGSQSSGVYLGTDGIQLGQAFKVDSTGQVNATNIAANNMVLTGVLTIGGQQITADALRGGAQSAYSTGSYWSGGASHGYTFGNAINRYSGSYPGYFRAAYMTADYLGADSLVANNILGVAGLNASWKSVTVKNSAGNNITINYLGR